MLRKKKNDSTFGAVLVGLLIGLQIPRPDFRRNFRSDYIHESPAKRDAAVSQGEKRVISTSAYVFARLEGRAALANNNRPSCNSLATIPLHTAVLRIAVATVTR